MSRNIKIILDNSTVFTESYKTTFRPCNTGTHKWCQGLFSIPLSKDKTKKLETNLKIDWIKKKGGMRKRQRRHHS